MKALDATEGLDASVIRRSWNRSTSSCPEEWSILNRARGQCAITALVVQDAIGGGLVRTVATTPDGREESHYATIHEHGVIIDLTASQFPEGTEFGPWEARTREYVLSYPETVERYLTFARRLNEIRTLEKLRALGVPA